MNWGDIVRTPNDEVGKVGQCYTLQPDGVEVCDVTVGCFFSLWRARDLTPATEQELEEYEKE